MALFESFLGVTNYYDKECETNSFFCRECKIPNILIFANLRLNNAFYFLVVYVFVIAFVNGQKSFKASDLLRPCFFCF